jgi:hypothetical protein
VVVQVQGVDAEPVGAQARAEPAGEELLQDGGGEDVVAEPEPQVLAAHRDVHVEQAVAQEEPVPERARDVLVAERVGFRVIELDDGPPGARVGGEGLPDLGELVGRAVPAA